MDDENAGPPSAQELVPRLLWRMKKPTRRVKDAPDLYFLLRLFEAAGEKPPDVN